MAINQNTREQEVIDHGTIILYPEEGSEQKCNKCLFKKVDEYDIPDPDPRNPIFKYICSECGTEKHNASYGKHLIGEKQRKTLFEHGKDFISGVRWFLYLE